MKSLFLRLATLVAATIFLFTIAACDGLFGDLPDEAAQSDDDAGLDAGTDADEPDTDEPDADCQSESDDEFCERFDITCGTLEERDNCDEHRTVECGSCDNGEECYQGECINPCESDEDCSDNETCDNEGLCIPSPSNGDDDCSADADCAGEAQICVDSECVELQCETNIDCPPGESCDENLQCVPDDGDTSCASDAECVSPNEMCCDGECVETQFSNDHCGSCGISCDAGAGEVCDEGSCIDAECSVNEHCASNSECPVCVDNECRQCQSEDDCPEETGGVCLVSADDENAGFCGCSENSDCPTTADGEEQDCCNHECVPQGASCITPVDDPCQNSAVPL